MRRCAGKHICKGESNAPQRGSTPEKRRRCAARHICERESDAPQRGSTPEIEEETCSEAHLRRRIRRAAAGQHVRKGGMCHWLPPQVGTSKIPAGEGLKKSDNALTLIELARCRLLRETQWRFYEPD